MLRRCAWGAFVFDSLGIDELIKLDVNQTFEDNSWNNKLEYANLFNYLRHDMAMMTPNYINSSYYCFPLLHSKRIWNITNYIPCDYREDSKLSLRLINS